ncbi:hypothetical protein [Nocardioides rubriscoriae]|uniref:hypothetical protein n=1 Tax=Nocardioides rubriscoriae TaxID=642762 RepID=UPI001479229B|nr:hypothetical protein [Nocardioides rubriscoriae]
MGLFSRSSTASAVHARVADGEHLWLAVRGADDDRLVLQRPGAPDLEVPAETEGDLLVAVFPLAAALAATDDPALELRLRHGRKAAPVTAALPPRPAGPTVPAPRTRDGRWQLSVDVVDDELVVRRTAVAPAVTLLGLRRVDDGVELRLDVATGSLAAGGVELPVTDHHVVLGALTGLQPGEPAPVLVDGLPVVRARNVIDRPQLAVALPPMLEPGVELRWLRDGRLATARREADA